MNPLTEERINEVHALCQRFGVQRLDVFGSAATGSFDPATSDIDLIVEFEDARSPDIAERYFGLKESFEALFGRSVDLVMAGAMRNPYFIESANRSRRPVYASALAATAGARIGHREKIYVPGGLHRRRAWLPAQEPRLGRGPFTLADGAAPGPADS